MIRSKTNNIPAAGTAAWLVIIITGFAILYFGRPVLVPLAFAGLFALMLYPLCRFFERNGFPRLLSIILTFIIVISALAGLIFLLSTQVYNFVRDLPNITDKLQAMLDDVEWFLYKNFNIQISPHSSLLQSSATKFLESGVVFLTGTISTFLAIFNFLGLVPIYVFLFLLYRRAFRNFVLIVTPMEKHRIVSKVLVQIQKIVQHYIVGLLSVIAIVAVLNSIVLAFLGVDYAIFFGIFIALLMIIPYLGMIVGALLPALYVLVTKDSIWYAVSVILGVAFVQFLEGNFITPAVTGSRVKINALAAIIALVIGGYLWGLYGLILAMPFVAILKVVLDNIASTKHFGFLLGTEIGDGAPGQRRSARNLFRIAGFNKTRAKEGVPK